MSITYEKTAFVRLEADGEIVLRDFAGHEWEIDVKRTRIIEALGEMKTMDFIRDMVDRSIRDTLILANLAPSHRKTPEQKNVILAAAKAREDGTTPRVFVNKRDRKHQERLERRLRK
jgi:hypothetical protein